MFRLLFTCATIVFATMAWAGDDAATVLAQKIAKRMQDTLQLTDAQKARVYEVNMWLNQQKMLVRQRYAQPDSARYYIQKNENSRDSLYQAILPAEKYLIYKDKKRNLVNNN